MLIWLGVKNFGKIEDARICINKFTVLVGPNNSGKTFLMQLAHGINVEIANLVDASDIKEFIVEEASGYQKYVIDTHNIDKLINIMNKNLYERKENIVRDIFKKNIEIEELKLEIELDKDEIYEIEYIDKNVDVELIKSRINAPQNIEKYIEEEKNIVVIKQYGAQNLINRLAYIGINTQNNILYYPLKAIFTNKSLFMPASRTGLMMLYKEYFANKADDAVNFYIDKNGHLIQEITFGDITRPTYEFLRFLQMYNDENKSEYYSDELKFFDRNIIEGHILVNKQGRFAYKQDNYDDNIPMYLASSMINEVAPIALALNSRAYDQLIIDEVEASLHPQKQQELVRLLVRLSNKDMSLIVSTHSDTFVSKINNLYVLSNKENANKYLEKLGFDKKDLMNTDNIYVYSFESNKNGKCSVKEIKPDKDYGYQFDLFMNSNLKLYKETSILEDGGNE